MGHYTGIAINVKLKADLSPEQIAILEFVTFNRPDKDWRNPPAPDRNHPMFKDDCWIVALSCQSAYLRECEKMQPKQGERFKRLPDGRYLLRAAASTKSYDLAMNLLPDWLSPLVDPSEYGKTCGEARYEYTAPTRFGFTADGVFKKEVERTKQDTSPWDYDDPYARDLHVNMKEPSDSSEEK